MKKIICVWICICITLISTCAYATTSDEDHSRIEVISCDGYVCPYCLADLDLLIEEVGNGNIVYCSSCGRDLNGFNPLESYNGAKYYGEYWYCDRCTSFLNNQDGFDDHLGTWACTKCGYKNSISYDMEEYTWIDFINVTIKRGDSEYRKANYTIALSNYNQANAWIDGTIEDDDTARQMHQSLEAKIDNCYKAIMGIEEKNTFIGQTIMFGHYEQDYYLENYPDRYLDNGPDPIYWKILDKTPTSLMLISWFPLDCMPYNDSDADAIWENSTLRRWLNGTFLEHAFFEDEKGIIEERTIDSERVRDKVFILSDLEYIDYTSNESIDLSDYYYKNKENVACWLRASGEKPNEALCVSSGNFESVNTTEYKGIRPVIWIDYKQYDWGNSAFIRANKAEELFDQGSYIEAMEIYDSLQDYWASNLFSIDCRMMSGEDAFENKDYSSALEWYLDAKSFILDHLPAEVADRFIKEIYLNEKIFESRKLQATTTEDNGNTNDSVTVKGSSVNEKNNTYIGKEAGEKKTNQSWLTDSIGSAVNAGKDTGFSQKNPIKKGDPHFGWGLGHFMMSGYTERTDNGELPVFIKKPGDALILSFVLDQNIDALNGDNALTIADDTNGYDEQYQSQSNFKRGALFVQHINAATHENNVETYTNFLESSDGKVADTKIRINEEGRYTVALDYEIKKVSKIMGVPKSDYYDYRICFSFEVKNGSSMVYLFDIESGSQLLDYAKTNTGFRIGFANNTTLRVNYTYYALNQSETSFDVRYQNISMDDESFEKPGWYVITSLNKETGEKVTKNIFVGDEDLLKKYQSIDPSLSRFQ